MQEGEPPIVQDEPISLYQNTLLAWGNLLYEDSQLAAATGSDWRPILDQATARFREILPALISGTDILTGHRVDIGATLTVPARSAMVIELEAASIN